MSLELEHSQDFDIDPLDIVEAVLEAANWPFERDEERRCGERQRRCNEDGVIPAPQ